MNIEQILINNGIPFDINDSVEEILLENYDKINLEEIFINGNCKNYKCFDILRGLLKNKEFRKMLVLGIINKEVRPFNDNIWEIFSEMNFRGCSSLEEAFMLGLNLGNCTNFSKEIGYLFKGSEICGGGVPLLVGTENCPNGNHTWMEYGGLIYDTSLMIIMTREFAKKLGYQEENRYPISQTPGYEAREKLATERLNNCK